MRGLLDQISVQEETGQIWGKNIHNNTYFWTNRTSYEGELSSLTFIIFITHSFYTHKGLFTPRESGGEAKKIKGPSEKIKREVTKVTKVKEKFRFLFRCRSEWTDLNPPK